MKLTVLMDNHTYIDQYYAGEPAVCYYLEDGERKVLLDVGYSGAFLENAAAMDIPLGAVDAIVLSHGHNDHTRGLPLFFQRFPKAEVSVVAHPDALLPKRDEGKPIGMPLSEAALSRLCRVQLHSVPLRLSKHLIFLGEIPRTQAFEATPQIGERYRGGVWEPDPVTEDSALVYQNKDGLFVLAGCSHSGICNIVEYAKQVCGEERILGILGGFHLFDVDERVRATADYLRQNNVQQLFPCHCTSFAVRAVLAEVLPVTEVGVGMKISL